MTQPGEPSFKLTVALNVLALIFTASAFICANGGVRLLLSAAVVLGACGGWRLSAHVTRELALVADEASRRQTDASIEGSSRHEAP